MTFSIDKKAFSLKLFNTKTRQKEAVKPLNGEGITLYTCGPTVYNYAHIGNFRTYVFEDLLRRTLQFFGWPVRQAMNITDVDDKTIRGAIAEKVSLKAYTEPFKEAFFEDLETLKIQKVEHYPAATDYIPDMISIIEALIEKGIAYQGGDGSVYYAIQQFPQYGCLSHLKLDELKVGASQRVASDEYEKDHVADFVLWKKYDPARDGEIYWDSPFGPGRPGWHLECSAMAMKLFGPTLDIHCGGVDNMFPHHENEIAQSEAYSSQEFVKLWMHAEHLVVNGKKMSKSLGNIYRLRELLDKGYTGVQVRYMLLQTHYKTQLNFTFEGLSGVKHTLSRLHDFVQRLLHIEQESSTGEVDPHLEKALLEFSHSLADDLNISAALAAVFDLVKEVNILCDQEKVGRKDAENVLKVMRQFDSVLGVLSFEKDEESVPQEIFDALAQREEARKNKNWALSDELRATIQEKGYVIEDTSDGARVKKG